MSWVEITREPARTLLHPPKRYALSFEKAGDSVELPIDVVRAMGTKFSIELWIKPLRWIDPSYGDSRIFANDKYRESGFAVLTHAPTNRLNFATHYDGGLNIVRIDHWSDYFGMFSQIVCVYDEDEPIQQIWHNGGLVQEITPTPMVYRDVAANLVVDNMISVIPLFRVYNERLTTDEIQHNYLNPMNPILDGLVLWLSLEEGSGTTAHDESGNGNDGTIHGARWIEVTRLPAR